MDAGYMDIHLANPSAIKQYEGLKYTDDQHDAFWLAKLLALGILPEGYIYPKESRPVRDLLRRRSFLVKHRTSYIHSLQSMIERYTSLRVSGNDLKKLEMKDIQDIFKEDRLVLSGEACLPGWPLQNVPPVATSKCPTPYGRPIEKSAEVRGRFSATERV